jgi:hypothetical protein
MTRRPAKLPPKPTVLVLTDEAFAAFEALGLGRESFDGIIQAEQAKGTSQEDFDALLIAEGARATAAKAANDQAEAERNAVERRGNRLALAGMALQGILAGPLTDKVPSLQGIATLAVDYADALLKALDAPTPAE